MKSDIERAKEHLVQVIKNAESDPFGLVEHVQIVERWARFILERHPEADKEVTLMGVWLHDIGHYPISEMDHAVIGEKRSREFLTSLKISPAKKDAICHCVRAHRCKDIMPQTIEAKIVACADSASHFTDFAYLDSIMKNKDNKKSYSITEKIERDYRDIALFPEVKRELEILYKKWKELVVEFKRVNDKV